MWLHFAAGRRQPPAAGATAPDRSDGTPASGADAARGSASAAPSARGRTAAQLLDGRRTADLPDGASRGREWAAPSSTEREVLRPLPGDNRAACGVLPGVRAPPAVTSNGRRGRRTGTMVRIARERLTGLFQLAEQESARGHGELADRYVTLARRIGMRYNVRLPREFRELYCRRCSAFWVEGRTVKTRLRGGRRVRTCLRCGGARRTSLRHRPARPVAHDGILRNEVHQEDSAAAVDFGDGDLGPTGDESEEE
jgi:ribonuclease P protein subunit RPR2